MENHNDDGYAAACRQDPDIRSGPAGVRRTDCSSRDRAEMPVSGYTKEYVLTAEKLAELIGGLRKDPFFRLPEMEDDHDDED